MDSIIEDIDKVLNHLEKVSINNKVNLPTKDEIFDVLTSDEVEKESDNISKVNRAVEVFMKKQERITTRRQSLEEENFKELDIEEENREETFKQREKREMFESLVSNYPDVDRRELECKSEMFDWDRKLVFEWLENNLHLLPEKKQVEAVSMLSLQDRLDTGRQELWRCPGCDNWSTISIGQEVFLCLEPGCKAKYCVKCRRRDHPAASCRQEIDRLRRAEHEVNIFAKLLTTPTRVEGYVRTFEISPRNDLDFTDPLQILYLAAEATFLRMIDKMGQSGTIGRRSIKQIDYVENEKLRYKFMERKAKFVADKIPSGERLVFHGTTTTNVKKILEENFQLDKCHRFAHGRGIYFSEFPEVSVGYGPGLVLSRILLGRTYKGDGFPVEQGWDTKMVGEDVTGRGQMVIVPDSNQILPVFVIHL